MPSIHGLVRGASASRFCFSLVLVTAAVGARPAGARSPQLDFDFGRTLACREMSSADIDDFSGAAEGMKIVEFTLQLSVHVLSGPLDQVQEIQVEISDCDRRMRVHQMSPSTQLASELAGDVEVTRTIESSRAASVSLGGELPAVIGDVIAHMTPSASGNLARREVVTEKQRRLAPQQVVVASGTINQQHGASFKLRPSAQTTLEGTHELTVQLIVPEGWRGDSLYVRCQATGQDKFLWLKQDKVWAREEAKVALFLSGDSRARQAAEAFAAR